MANGLKPLAGLCGLLLLGVNCNSDPDSDASSAAGAPTTAGSGGATTSPTAAQAGKNATAGTTAGRGSEPASAGMTGSAGASSVAGNAGKGGSSGGGDPPPAVDGQSIYALECHGDSKDCNFATVPCFGVGSPTPNVAAGWACANRCKSNADCSDAPSGAEAKASCVSFAAAGHCVLVCQNENQTFSCPDGMGCYVPEKSPIGYCLWQ